MLHQAYATHLQGGEIIARQMPNAPLTFEITVISYTDSESTVEFGSGVLRFGDDNVQNGPFTTTKEDLGKTHKISFTTTHTFLSPSAAGYLISYQEDFRNSSIININDGNSVQTTFYIETLVVMDPFLGPNSTPYFTVAPNRHAISGQRYRHNPAAYDPDGDLLTYRFVDVKRAHQTIVDGYRSLIDPNFYTNYSQGNEAMDGEPTLTIDRFTGEIIWDAPGNITNQETPTYCSAKAEYAVAIAVDEWRKVGGTWRKMGFVTRDYQIIVCRDGNVVSFPELPMDTCIIAGNTLSKSVSISESEYGPLYLYSSGIPFKLGATIDQAGETLEINWETSCSHAGESPYQIQILLSNNSNPLFEGYHTWNINLLGPEVTGLSIQDQQDGTAILSWDPYSCPNADSIEIWRKVGDYEGDICDLTDPQSQGFDLVGDITAGMTTFTADLPSGTTSGDYTWHLKATFPGSSHDYKELISVLTNVKSPGVVGVNVFPNPSNGTVFIDGHKRFKYYRILDISGKLMLEGELKTPQLDNLNVLEDGIYIMSLLDEKQNQVHGTRLLIQK
ncbi:MAG: T9SS type A sorting domain-containing protein [Cyclobacteriaceae bacterium]|nr:T9SS type A sorting domain-containing protein [Cyclobacteriaceae bacterium SS2]